MKLAAESGVPFLGCIPLDPRIGRCCDEGKSYLSEVPDSPATQAYKAIVDSELRHMRGHVMHSSVTVPTPTPPPTHPGIVSECTRREENGDDEQM